MEVARWTRIEELLQAALDLDPAARPAFLTAACGSDGDLRREIDALLAHEREQSILSHVPMSRLPIRGPEVLTGHAIAHYDIGARIGRGGMGEVYEARDERLQRVIALKTLPAEWMDDEDRVRRFEREALTVSRLNHPNIITIFEILRDGDAHFIATERVEGRTLREMLIDPATRQPRALPMEQALDIATQVAGALKAAHTAWVIHRDIKPENIMIRSDGLVKVLDFGIAKLTDEPSSTSANRIPARDEPSSCDANEIPADEADSSRRRDGNPASGDPRVRSAKQQTPPVVPALTHPGAILGTANYMSPEQARGEPLDGRTDLFSLGMVLYEMLAGRRYERDQADGTFGRHSGGLQRIVRRLLRSDRRERYSSAGELLDDLDRVKRRISSRTARRIAGLSAIAVAAAAAVVTIAALLSVDESWDERILRDGHRAAARQAVFSPDGRLLASCGEDGQIILWDFARRERLATLAGPAAHKIAFSPDGRLLATGGVDGSITVWDVERRATLHFVHDHRQEVSALAFSPDGTVLVSASHDGRTLLWSTNGWRKLREWPQGGAHGTFLFGPAARQIVSTSGWIVYEPATGRSTPHAGVRSPLDLWSNWAAVSPDQTQFITIDPLGNVSFHRLGAPVDFNTPELIATQRAHQDHGRATAFSPDGRLAASGAEDIVLWDALTHRKIVRLEHTAVVWSLAFSPDGRWLISSHGDGAVLVWDVAERELKANLSEHSGAVRAVAFSQDGRHAVSGSEDRTVTVWNTDTPYKEAVLTGHETRVTAVAFARAGDAIASGDQDGTTILWDLAQRRPRWVYRPARWEALYTLAISPDGRYLASSIGLHATRDGRMLASFVDRRGSDRIVGAVYGVAFSADGQRLAAVTDTGSIHLFDGTNGRLLEKHQLPGTDQISVDLSNDGKWLVTGEDQGAVRLWAVAPLREVAVLGRHGARVKSVAFSPDSTTVVSAGDDRVIALWDVERRKLRARVGTHASPIYSIAFSSDGRHILSGEHDRSVRVYRRQRSLWGIPLDDVR